MQNAQLVTLSGNGYDYGQSTYPIIENMSRDELAYLGMYVGGETPEETRQLLLQNPEYLGSLLTMIGTGISAVWGGLKDLGSWVGTKGMDWYAMQQFNQQEAARREAEREARQAEMMQNMMMIGIPAFALVMIAMMRR